MERELGWAIFAVSKSPGAAPVVPAEPCRTRITDLRQDGTEAGRGRVNGPVGCCWQGQDSRGKWARHAGETPGQASSALLPHPWGNAPCRLGCWL